MAAITSDANSDAPSANAATGCFNTDHGCAITDKAGHFAFLDNIDAKHVCCACIAPCYGIMAGGAAAPLYQGAVNRETRVA